MKRFFRQLLCIVFLLTTGISISAAQEIQGDTFVEASVDITTPYVGQQIIYTFKLYDAVGTTNPLYAPSDFDGFWRVDIGVVSQVSEQIAGRSYVVTTIATALYPTQSGEMHIQPASVVLPETVFRAESRLSASVLTIQVRPLPAGQPTVFDGAVGTFEMAASLNRQSAPLGEPITMVLTLSGTGNVEQLPSPVVPPDWRSSINAGAYTSEIQNGIVIGKRAYTILFYPSLSGKQLLPSITLNYFDPSALVYRSASTSQVEIEVIGAANVNSQPSEVAVNSLKLKTIGSLARNTGNLSVLVFIFLLTLPVLSIGGVVGWRQFQRIQKAQKIAHNKQHALQDALAQIDKLKSSDGQVVYERMRVILQEYVAHKLGIEAITLKNRDLSSLLGANNVSADALSFMRELLDRVDEGVFAPATATAPAARIDKFKKILTSLDQCWVQM